jgi:hypothetical protein
MRSRGIWLTVLMRGVQLNSLTPSNGGTTAPISYNAYGLAKWGNYTHKSRLELQNFNKSTDVK